MICFNFQSPSILTITHPIFINPNNIHLKSHFKLLPSRRTTFSVNSSYRSNSSLSSDRDQWQQPQQQPRTLFPGGFKRPEIKVPTLVLQLNCEQVLDEEDTSVLDLIDGAVSKSVGIVILNGGELSGGKLYEAACLLKSVIRDRAYMIIAERVDIAAAVGASGVLLSDRGLPTIVARNMMMESKPDSVTLPLVARNVENANEAVAASTFEGADFLIYGSDETSEELVSSISQRVKIPTFIMIGTPKSDQLFDKASNLMKSGGSGLVISPENFKVLGHDNFDKLFHTSHASNDTIQKSLQSLDKAVVSENGFPAKNSVASFVKIDEREQLFIEKEKLVLLEAITAIQRAAPLMEEVSLLADAVSQLDEPFLLVIVGEFNSGKSTFINALLGKKYVSDGVVPTTNEITFLRYSELDLNEQERCERHPDGQYTCYLPAPILKGITIVDTPGTNVILQRQQRLTEEFVPRADLLLFVISADRPLTESEVTFLRYTQQWKKRVVFVLNKADIYLNAAELEEATTFIKENTKKLLNTENITLYPVSARFALESKLSSMNNSGLKAGSFYELEQYLYSFLDGSTSTGFERMKLKLETPIRIAEQLLSSCQKTVNKELQQAKKDLETVNELIASVQDYALRMESEGISWKRQSLAQIDSAQGRVVKLVESILQLSNLDLVTKYIFNGEKSGPMPPTSTIRNEILVPALSEAQKQLGEYVTWLHSNNSREGKFYKETFEKRWPLFVDESNKIQLETGELLSRKHQLSTEVIEEFSAPAASKLFEQEIREVFLGTFGGLGVAGVSASLLTSVLPTTLEDLLALGLCSTGGLVAISKFPGRRQKVIEKVKRTADAMALKLEDAMQKDLSETTESLQKYVNLIGKPYLNLAQERVDKLLVTEEEVTNVAKKMKALQIEIQNLHIS